MVLGIFLSVAMARLGLAQEMVIQNRLMETEGTIMSADWVGDKMLVDGEDGQLEFVVTDDVKVTKGTETMA